MNGIDLMHSPPVWHRLMRALDEEQRSCVCVGAGEVATALRLLVEARGGKVRRSIRRRAQRDPDQRGGERCVSVQDNRGEPASFARHAARLCAPGRSVQGARGGGVPVTCQMQAVHMDNAPP